MTTLTRLLAAIAAQDDDQAEKLVHRLAPAEETNLIELAGSGDADQRWWAVRGLALIGTAPAVSVVDNALQDDDVALRAAGALALAHIHAREPVAASASMQRLAALLADDDGLVRQAAADALAMCGDDAVSALAGVLDSQHGGARARAAYALRKIGTMKAASLLYPLLNDPNHLVRAYAYDGLDAMGLLDNVLLIP